MSWLAWGWHIDVTAFGVGIGLAMLLLLLTEVLTRADPPPEARERSLEEMLAIRLAAGEIDRESYSRILEELHAH